MRFDSKENEQCRRPSPPLPPTLPTFQRPLRLEAVEEQGAGGDDDQGAAHADEGEAGQDESPEKGQGRCCF